jgi:hypothetical protein
MTQQCICNWFGDRQKIANKGRIFQLLFGLYQLLKTHFLVVSLFRSRPPTFWHR